MKVKFCGIRRPEDVEYANITRPDYIGFIFAPSKRYISPEDAAAISESLNPVIKKAGVFVNAEGSDIVHTADICGLDVIQLHGDEDAEMISYLRERTECEIWKAVRVKSSEDILNAEKLGADVLLLDSFSKEAYGGTGKVADWDVIRNTDISMPYFIAGGLTAENIPEALNSLSPYGFDISGGIETDGCKDLGKMQVIMTVLGRE